jgi:hypothetical protein
MVKKRIIPKFLIKDGRLVKGVRFHENFREAGNPVTTAKIYDSYGVDELIFLDILASIESRKTVIDIIERASQEIFMPFTVGGGVKSLEDINEDLFKELYQEIVKKADRHRVGEYYTPEWLSKLTLEETLKCFKEDLAFTNMSKGDAIGQANKIMQDMFKMVGAEGKSWGFDEATLDRLTHDFIKRIEEEVKKDLV